LESAIRRGIFFFSKKLPKEDFSECEECGRLLESELLEAFSSINSLAPKAFDFYDLYAPNRIDFENVEYLVNEAIKIFESDNHLSLEAKLKIVNHLKEVLRLLDKGQVTNFWGAAKEIIIVLGALGSMAGAVPGYIPLIEAQQKLVQAVEVAEQNTIDQDIPLLPSSLEEESCSQNILSPGEVD
jgi:hypothetical protein